MTFVCFKTYKPQLFRCPRCGAEDYRTRSWIPAPHPLYKGDETGLPVICGSISQDVNEYAGLCRGEMDQVLTGITHDLLPASFGEVDGETIGRGPAPVRISSLRELRKIERDSRIRHEAEPTKFAPYVFREFSQGHSNRDVNAFKGSALERSFSRKVQKPTTQSGLPISVTTKSGG